MDKKLYGRTILESSFAFLLSTLFVASYFVHLEPGWLKGGILIGALYLIVITLCTARIIKPLPVAVVMILIPIIPLVALLFLISFIHLLQMFS